MTDLEQKLLQLFEDEHARANYLEQLLFERLGLVEKDQVITVDNKKAIGRLPWDRQRKILEARFRTNEGLEAVRNDPSDNGSEDVYGEAGEAGKQEKEVHHESQKKEGE